MTIVYISNYSVSCTPFPSLITFVLSVRPKKLVSVYPAQNRALGGSSIPFLQVYYLHWLKRFFRQKQCMLCRWNQQKLHQRDQWVHANTFFSFLKIVSISPRRIFDHLDSTSALKRSRKPCTPFGNWATIHASKHHTDLSVPCTQRVYVSYWDFLYFFVCVLTFPFL